MGSEGTAIVSRTVVVHEEYHLPVVPPFPAIAKALCQIPPRAGNWQMPVSHLPTTLVIQRDKRVPCRLKGGVYCLVIDSK